jgi:hypothetical protein
VAALLAWSSALCGVAWALRYCLVQLLCPSCSNPAQVTVVEFTDRIAAGADGDIVYADSLCHSEVLTSSRSTEFTKELTKQGMQFKMQSKVTGAGMSRSSHCLSCMGLL